MTPPDVMPDLGDVEPAEADGDDQAEQPYPIRDRYRINPGADVSARFTLSPQ